MVKEPGCGQLLSVRILKDGIPRTARVGDGPEMVASSACHAAAGLLHQLSGDGFKLKLVSSE